MKNYEMLAKELTSFPELEEYQKIWLIDYINCPSSKYCKFDGEDDRFCVRCKIKWLESEVQK